MIEVHHDVRDFGGEVGGRVVKSEVGILTDAGETEVDWAGGDTIIQSLHFGIQICGIAIDRNEVGLGWKLADETFAQVFPEAGAMRFRQADIFVEMEDRDLGPIDAWLLD